MSTYGILFMAGLALAPFTNYWSLLLTLGVIVKAAIVTKPRTPTDEEMAETWQRARIQQGENIKRMDDERDQNVQAWIQSERTKRAHQQQINEALNPTPSAYAWYQCSGMMCRHQERLLVWHGDRQECEQCGRATYREG